jgi:hypothetical protein
LQNEASNSSFSSLSDRVRLRKNGEITADKFFRLKRQLIYGAEPAVAAATTPPKPRRSLLGFDGSGLLLIGLVAAGLMCAGHLKGGMFPDDFYCAVGAGVSYDVASRSEATGWSANNGCGASGPECAIRGARHRQALTARTARCGMRFE